MILRNWSFDEAGDRCIGAESRRFDRPLRRAGYGLGAKLPARLASRAGFVGVGLRGLEDCPSLGLAVAGDPAAVVFVQSAQPGTDGRVAQVVAVALGALLASGHAVVEALVGFRHTCCSFM